ncbi:MAG: penicillin acylase family protein [Sediminibacterium sp.]|nr:penicillin acylase family protein [Sediminibacterium sp.]
MLFVVRAFCSALLACIFFTAHAQDKKSLAIKGLQSEVEVLRDEWGVNHIYARNQHDLFFTQGYCAVKDRLFQFEIWRLQASGTVSSVLGPRELNRDIGTRLFAYRGDMSKELAHYHPQGVAIINAYVEGVNAYITEILRTPGKLPAEFRLLKILPGKWTPEIVISRHQGLLGNAPQELNIGRAVTKGGVDKVKNAMWFHPKDPLLVMDSSIRGELLYKDILGLYDASHANLVFQSADLARKPEDEDAVLNLLNKHVAPREEVPEKEMEGSNNWIVNGSRTASGHAMLANDPHRKIAVPSLRYIVHLVAPGWNVIGGGEPEIPGVSIGHNEEGAWGLTIYETDGEDLYVYDLDPNNLNRYKYQGAWVTMKEIKETIHMKQSGDTTVTLRYTQHGPVTYIDTANRKAYALRCAWLEPGGAPYLASLRIDQAKTWEAFREACSYSHIPGENMIWADRKGNTGWQAVGIIPIRKNFSGYVPVPGDGRYEWAGYLPIKERPHLFNPAPGFFATANQHVTPDSYTHWDAVGYTWADPFRGNRVNEVLAANDHISMQEMQALQTDYYSLPARTLVPFLKNIFFTDPTTLFARQQLLDWDYRLDKNSIAAGIYVMWDRQIMLNGNKQFVSPDIKPWINMQLTSVIRRLQQPEKYFTGNAVSQRDQFIKESFEEAVALLKNQLGNNTSKWQYGQDAYKHVTMEHLLSGVVSKAWQDKLNVGPLPRGGNSHTPGSTGGTDNQVSGASFRFIADTGDWDKAVMINTPGQSGDPASPFYKNLFSLWANDQYFPAYYSKEKIRSVTVERVVLRPVK